MDFRNQNQMQIHLEIKIFKCIVKPIRERSKIPKTFARQNHSHTPKNRFTEQILWAFNQKKGNLQREMCLKAKQKMNSRNPNQMQIHLELRSSNLWYCLCRGAMAQRAAQVWVRADGIREARPARPARPCSRLPRCPSGCRSSPSTRARWSSRKRRQLRTSSGLHGPRRSAGNHEGAGLR